MAFFNTKYERFSNNLSTLIIHKCHKCWRNIKKSIKKTEIRSFLLLIKIEHFSQLLLTTHKSNVTLKAERAPTLSVTIQKAAVVAEIQPYQKMPCLISQHHHSPDTELKEGEINKREKSSYSNWQEAYASHIIRTWNEYMESH